MCGFYSVSVGIFSFKSFLNPIPSCIDLKQPSNMGKDKLRMKPTMRPGPDSVAMAIISFCALG